MQKLTAIEEFDDLYNLPGGCNILAAGKNTPIWPANNPSIVTQFHQTQQTWGANANSKDNSIKANANTVKIRY